MEKGSSSSSSSSSAAANGGPDSLNGLKFGKKIYYEGVGSGLRPKTSGGPAKKGRAGPVLGGGHAPRCQVEGCKVDLSDAKAYYSRHKVCGMHSKSAKVIVAGLEQRFCQQCSRFHQLPEFDQGKRSCRRRLAGHNERRRKPPQGSLSSPRYGTICPSLFDNNHSSKTGGFVMDFSAYPSLAGRDLFPNPTSEQGLTTNNQADITGKFQLPLLSNNSPNPLSDLLTSRPSYSRPVVSPDDGSFNIGVSDSSNALSLLSNLPWAGPKGHLGANSFLNQPPDDPPPGSTIGQFVCSPWGFKGNGNNDTLHEMHPDLGLGQAMNGQYNNGGLELGQPSEDPQFNEMDQTSGYYSSSSVQHNIHRPL